MLQRYIGGKMSCCQSCFGLTNSADVIWFNHLRTHMASLNIRMVNTPAKKFHIKKMLHKGMGSLDFFHIQVKPNTLPN